MKIEKTLNEGYGHYFGFGNTHWASATAGILHVWKEFKIISSYDIPSFEKGNITFTNDILINVGLFQINLQNHEKKYQNSIVEQFAMHCEDGRGAHYSQYKIEEVLHTKGESTLISIAYQPPKRNSIDTHFDGPTNRLLLFEDSNLIEVIDENYDSTSYSNLFLLKNKIVFAKENECYVVAKENPHSQTQNLKGFIPLYYSETNNIIAGSFNNKHIQIRDISDLKLLKQMPETFSSVEHIIGYDNILFLAVNENLIQVWQNVLNNETYQERFSLKGIIEAIAFDNKNNCFIALANAENKIIILSMK